MCRAGRRSSLPIIVDRLAVGGILRLGSWVVAHREAASTSAGLAVRSKIQLAARTAEPRGSDDVNHSTTSAEVVLAESLADLLRGALAVTLRHGFGGLDAARGVFVGNRTSEGCDVWFGFSFVDSQTHRD